MSLDKGKPTRNREGHNAPQEIRGRSNVLVWAYAWMYAQGSNFWERLTSPGQVPFVNARVIWRLIIAFLILVPLIGRFSDYREGAGHDSLFIQVVWRVVWVSYNLLQVAIVALLLLAIYRYVKLRSSGYGQDSPKPENDLHQKDH
jgi:hypothetical protein